MRYDGTLKQTNCNDFREYRIIDSGESPVAGKVEFLEVSIIQKESVSAISNSMRTVCIARRRNTVQS